MSRFFQANSRFWGLPAKSNVRDSHNSKCFGQASRFYYWNVCSRSNRTIQKRFAICLPLALVCPFTPCRALHSFPYMQGIFAFISLICPRTHCCAHNLLTLPPFVRAPCASVYSIARVPSTADSGCVCRALYDYDASMFLPFDFSYSLLSIIRVHEDDLYDLLKPKHLSPWKPVTKSHKGTRSFPGRCIPFACTRLPTFSHDSHRLCR